ncbi:MAG: class I SAM-dependent methyltransferase [Chloroflexota bacterium]
MSGALPSFAACPGGGDHGRLVLIGTAMDRSSGAPYRVFGCARHSIDFVDADGSFDVAQTEASLDVLYGSVPELESADVPPRVARFLDIVSDLRRAPGILHDHGCGNGTVAVAAVRRGWTVQGNDLVRRPGAALRAAGVTYHEGSLASLDLESSADVVTSYCVLPHVIDPVAELREIRRVLRPGGWVVAEMPSNGLFRRVAKSLHRATRGRWQWVLGQLYAPNGHRFGFDARSARESLVHAGFRNVRVFPFRHEARHTRQRFASSSRPVRAAAWVAVGVLDLAARLPGANNHIVAVGQK